jgi:hypothetical protein
MIMQASLALKLARQRGVLPATFEQEKHEFCYFSEGCPGGIEDWLINSLDSGED